MELRIKPFPKNSYPKKGLLIKGSSPLIWLREMEGLGIDLNNVKSFAIPSNEPNILYGCFLIFSNYAPREIGKNAYLQSVDNKLFIPENTIFYPQISPEEWEALDSEYLIMHPDFGLVKLSDQINWLEIIQDPVLNSYRIRKPSKSVTIPYEIKSYTVELDDEKLLEALSNTKTEEEWMKDLPFDLKKVLAGNKREIAKYLKYIEQHPERIVDLGVPLDIMGTSRGDGFSVFRFGGGMFGGLLGNMFSGRNSGTGKFSGGKGSGKKNYFLIFWIVLIILSIVRFALRQDKNSSSQENANMLTSKVSGISKDSSDPLVFQSGVTEIDIKIDSLYGKRRNELSRELNTTRKIYSNDNEAIIKEHLHRGGRKIEKVEDDIFFLKNRMKRSKDSLKQIYREKIVNEIESQSESFQKRISDSIKKSNNGNPVDKAIVKSIWNKKQILMIDSLGNYYGTKEEPQLPVIHDRKNNFNDLNSSPKNKTSFMEIVWVILFMIGAVGLYNHVVRKNHFDFGGENLPGGVKVLLMTILAGMLIYIFYPLVSMFGYNWFVWLLIVCVVVILYRLFNKDKNILKSD